MQRVESGTPVNISDDGVISVAPGTLLGFYVNSTSSGVVQIYNGPSASATAISGQITPVIGWREFPAYCPAGCYIEKVSGSINITAIFAAG